MDTPSSQHTSIPQLLRFTVLLMAIWPSVAIFGWSASNNQPSDQSRHHKYEDQLNSNPFSSSDWNDAAYADESSTMQHAAESYEHRTDCFKTAARALRQDCKNMDMDEDDKTQYAIRLTACEIATANIPMPVECREICEEKSYQHHSLSGVGISSCVQSLGRVPQLWTSYSGYYREAKVMCLAVGYSLERDDFRRSQRNLTRSYESQIALLRAQRQELLETRRAEVARLKEITELHSSIKQDMEATKLSINALGDSLKTVGNEVSAMVQQSRQGVAQQATAFSNLQRTNEQQFRKYQMDMEKASHGSSFIQSSVSRTIHDLQELDKLSKGLRARSEESKQGLDYIVKAIDTTKDRLGELTDTASRSSRSLIDQQAVSAKEMNVSTQAMLATTLSALDTLHVESQAAWSSTIDAYKLGIASFHDEASMALKATMSDIEKSNQLMSEIEVKQGDVLRQLQTSHGALGFFTGAIMMKMSMMDLVASTTILALSVLHGGHGAARCEWLSTPVQPSILHSLLCLLSAKLVLWFIRTWLRSSVRDQAPKQHRIRLRVSEQDDLMWDDGGYGEYYQDTHGGSIEYFDLPPSYSQDGGHSLPGRKFALHRARTTREMHASHPDPYDPYHGYSGPFGLELGSCA
ncbi:hypothetical protein B0O80DRAFT_533690 [Mortierella sp. GBAus27b]|nr:hypothetical protein B0O80DRAFT_533690 [Mortierella sp. GBAus27b]